MVSEFIQFQVQLGADNPKQGFTVETQQGAMLCKSLDSNSLLLWDLLREFASSGSLLATEHLELQ